MASTYLRYAYNASGFGGSIGTERNCIYWMFVPSIGHGFGVVIAGRNVQLLGTRKFKRA